MSNYVDVFGNSTLPPSDYGYQGLTISTDTTFEWPYNSAGSYTVSKITNLGASVAGLAITLPDARQVSTGEDFLIRNVGANQFTVKSADGTVLATLDGGQVKYFYLTDNTTLGGAYSVVAYGVGTSTVDAGTLVGYGLVAIGSSLNQSHEVISDSSATVAIDATVRSKLLLLSGGNTTCTLPQSSAIGNNFFFLARNNGSGVVTFDPYEGETIDGAITFSIQPGESLLIFNSGTSWFTVGYGRALVYNFTQLVKDVSAGGTIALTSVEASNKLLTFVGNPTGEVTITVPNSVAVYYVLNSLSTAHSVTIKTVSGGGAVVLHTERVILICDSTNVFSAQSVITTTSISLVDGTPLLPALNFSSKTSTGLFRSGLQDVGFSVNGTQVAAFNSSGLKVNALSSGYVKGGATALTTVATIPGSDVSGNIPGNAAGITGTLPIVQGGTGQTTKTAAFDGLSPTTTKGDLIVNNGTNNVRLPVGTDTYIMVADSTQPTGVKWASPPTITITNLTGGVAGSLVYQSATGVTAYATINGLVKSDGSGAPSAVVSGTDIKTINGTSLLGSGDIAVGDVTTAGTQTLTNKTISGASNTITADSINAVGFKEIPQNSQSSAYTLVLSDSGKHILHPSADTTARTFTIPANSSVAFPIGTAITFVNQNGAGVVTIAITTDTMRLAGAGTTGSRTLAANGVATAIKLTATEWIISGTNLT